VLLQTHYNQLVTTPAARPVLTVLKDILYARVKVSVGIEFCTKEFFKVNAVFSKVFIQLEIIFLICILLHVR